MAIGDIHGRNCWKEGVLSNKVDKTIFIGDYVDSYHFSDEQIINNLSDIIQYKKDNIDSVILLIGNHDLQYMYFPHFRCSGFRPSIQKILTDMFQENINLFQVAYQYNDYLFTHAGVSSKWYKWMKDIFKEIEVFNPSNLAESLNIISKSKDSYFLHSVGYKRGGLQGHYGGPTWADRDETMEGILPGIHQIVGHTPHREITTISKFMGNRYTDRSITYIDVLENSKDFYVLEI